MCNGQKSLKTLLGTEIRCQLQIWDPQKVLVVQNCCKHFSTSAAPSDNVLNVA